MVCGMFVCVSLSINVCMFTVSNALLMSNATAMVRVGGMGWLKPVATVMLCSAVFVECLVLNTCCVVMFGANCIHLPRLSGGPAAQFFGEASRASPQHGWRSAYSSSSSHHIHDLCWYRFLVKSVPSSRDVVRYCF